MTIAEEIKKNCSAMLRVANSGAIKSAETMLMNNENVQYAIIANVYNVKNEGKLKVNTGIKLKNRISAVVVITDKRVFYCSSSLGNVQSKQIRLQDIQSADYSTMIGNATIRIQGVSDMMIIETTKKVAEIIIPKINELQSNIDTSPAYFNNVSNADEILKYKKLYDEGIISQEEFEKKKQELLK